MNNSFKHELSFYHMMGTELGIWELKMNRPYSQGFHHLVEEPGHGGVVRKVLK